jgi:DNA-binding FadR family transcriptional regulator
LAATIPSPERVIEVGRGYDASRDFHATVLEASGNPLLAAAAAPIFAVLRYRFIRDRAPAGFWDEVAADHRKILGAMQQHDPDAAVEAMESHLMKLRATYVLIDTAQTADSQELVRRHAASAQADGSTGDLGAQDHRP